MNEDKKQRVYISGIGVVSPLGNTAEAFFQALEESYVQPCHKFYNQDILAQICDSELYKQNVEEYFIEICSQAIKAAVTDWGEDISQKKGCLIIGTGMGVTDGFLRKSKKRSISELEKVITNRLKLNTEVIVVTNACCAGAQAVGYGNDLLDYYQYDFVIAGGVEIFSFITYNGFKRLQSLDEEGCHPFDRDRRGISVGDGAAFFILERQKRRERNCFLAGYSVTNDAYHIVQPRMDGKYLKVAIEKAICRAGVACSDIHGVVAHGTGTTLNDRIESDVLYQLFGAIDVTAPKGRIGHTGGASGVFGMLTAILSLENQYLPPVINLSHIDETIKIKPVLYNRLYKKMNYILVNAIAFGGTNTAIICGREDEQKR